MISNDTIIKVKSRSNGSVGYRIPELNGLKRTFSRGEIKEIPFEELKRLSYIPGGKVLIKEYLVVNSPEALDELGIEVEPEYFYGEDEVKNLLERGSIEQFLDCLDFAPDGTLDLVKDLAVRYEVSDVRKREAIKEKLGFDVTKAIAINKEVEDGDNAAGLKMRRAAAPSIAATEAQPASPTRRYVVTKTAQ